MNFSTGEKKITKPLRASFAIADDQFARVMGGLLGPTLVSGNRVTAFYNGDEIFPAMLESISHATRCICFETYIYWAVEIRGAN